MTSPRAACAAAWSRTGCRRARLGVNRRLDKGGGQKIRSGLITTICAIIAQASFLPAYRGTDHMKKLLLRRHLSVVHDRRGLRRRRQPAVLSFHACCQLAAGRAFPRMGRCGRGGLQRHPLTSPCSPAETLGSAVTGYDNARNRYHRHRLDGFRATPPTVSRSATSWSCPACSKTAEVGSCGLPEAL